MRTRQQSGDGRTEASRQAAGARPAAGRSVPGHAPGMLLGIQRAAGNTAASAVVENARRGRAPAAPAPASAPAPAAASVASGRAGTGMVLPPYLASLETAGLSAVYGLTGHEFVEGAVKRAVGYGAGATGRKAAGGGEDTVGEIAAELAGRPESFFGQGRAFAVRGPKGKDWFDVTVRITPADDERRPVFHTAKERNALPAGRQGPVGAVLDHPEGKETKVDVQHNSVATASATSADSSDKGVGGTAFLLWPGLPGTWGGVAVTGAVRPWESGDESRTQRTAAEPRVLRSDKGTVEVERRVRFDVRVQKSGTRDVQPFQQTGTLTQRVPTEHLVPDGTAAPRGPIEPEVPSHGFARRVRLADSLAPVGVSEEAAPHEGGGGLFDTVASVLHQSVTAPGAPGRARLYEATSTANVLEDLPRLLGDGVVGEDLWAKDGRTACSYRMRADIAGLTPAWPTGKTQLRTHQQSQHTATATASDGRAARLGVGPAFGFGAPAGVAAARGTVMPVGGVRKARFSMNEQTVTSRQGAEVRGEKVLYLATVRFTAEGTGPRPGAVVLNPRLGTATHAMKVWMSLRSDEARDLGLPLPPGTEAGELVKKPKATGEDGQERDVERHLAYENGSSVVLSHVDSRPTMDAVTELFGNDARLAGYLPLFGGTRAVKLPTTEEAETQRGNYRSLALALSETNLKANKAQLLSTGIPVRLRRKSKTHSHDVLVRVKGRLDGTRYLGDTKDWMTRGHSGITSNAQTGRNSSRSLGVQALGQARLIPGILTASARYEKQWSGKRRNQGGPSTRTDTLTNGSETASVFGASLLLDVNVSLTSRPRKLTRTVTPGSPGRQAPTAQPISTLHLGAQDVRLSTPQEFTLDDSEKSEQDADTERRKAGPAPLERPFALAGIGDLAALVQKPAAGSVVRDWQLLETVGDGAAVRDLAFALLSKAAARGTGVRGDDALATEGLAPRLAIEERLSPQALHAALRQATSSGWVVKNLRHARRLAALNGAVGSRMTLANPRFLHKGAGPGTETLVLGGHQSAGQEGRSTSSSWQFGAMGSETVAGGRTSQGLAYHRTASEGGAESSAVSGTVERNAHTPKKAPLYLVQCDLLVHMVAEVGVTTGGPYVESRALTLPAEAAVWLTEAQLPASVRRQVERREKREAGAKAAAEARAARQRDPESGESSGTGAERAAREGTGGGRAPAAPAAPTGAGTTAPPAESTGPAESTAPARAASGAGHVLDRALPLGLGMIENLPNFVPLLGKLRDSLARGPRRRLAEDLLPRQQLNDRHDNVQRLLRVLDRSGSTGLLSGAMDGGVTVELFDGRNTPYWAVFRIDRSDHGTFLQDADDGRDMEYITAAVAQQAGTRDQGVTQGVEGVFAGSARPEDGLGGLKGVGGGGGAGFATGSSRRHGSASRGQVGMKLVAEAKSAPSAKMRVPITANLELFGASGARVSLARLSGLELTHRVPVKDLEALGRVRTPAPALAPARTAAPTTAAPTTAAPTTAAPTTAAPTTGAPAAVPAPGGPAPADRSGAARPDHGAWRARGVQLPLEAQVNGFQGAPRVRQLMGSAVQAAGGGERFRDKGQAAAYALNEAISTEWMIAALPLLVSAGADLPPVHASGVEGQDLRASVHARLREGRVLGVGDTMTFETVGQSHLGAPRPTQGDGSVSAEQSRSGRGMGGAALLNPDELRLNQLMGTVGGSGGAAAAAGNSAGSWPLVKPKTKSVLVRFTLDVRVVAEVGNRARAAVGMDGTGGPTVRELTLPQPVVIRVPEPLAQRMVRTAGPELRDPENHLGVAPAAAPTPPAAS
ncbi:hypothetical protein [Streptomyces sp. NPDC008125]|uniref:hypothetical protein n=1 Tax=Streptomyces sp. NPDC008125 TaxID=3364811 RepID=UPI0036EEBD80